MPLEAARTATLGRIIAADYEDVQTIDVAATHGGSDRVELLVSILGVDQRPHVHMWNLTRTRSVDFERDLRRHLDETLIDRLPSYTAT